MTNLFRSFTKPPEERGFAFPFQEYMEMFNYGGVNYPLAGMRQTIVGNQEEIRDDYTGFITGAYRANGIVFACMLVRMLHFTEARFQFRQIRAGRPGNLFGTPDLGPLETPWTNGTTGDLLARMIQDVDLAGNSFILRTGSTLFRLRPDWVEIMLGSRSKRKDFEPGDTDTEVAGYWYHPGGKGSGRPTTVFPAADVAHFAPIPDPAATYKGMSWVTSLIREIQADGMMTSHKLKFLEQGATVNLVVTVPTDNLDRFNEWVSKIREGHDGIRNAYKTMFLAQGADVTPIGSDLQQMAFKDVQGAGEVRIASVARVPPVLLGLSEGLQGSTLNSGNYQASRRMFADGCIRPLWRQAAGALSTIIRVPAGSELWYDDRDIAFLKEDLKDTAEVQQMQSAAMNSLVAAGFEPSSIVDAVTSNDFSRLIHSGLVSVQLVPPGQNGATANGKQPVPVVS